MLERAGWSGPGAAGLTATGDVIENAEITVDFLGIGAQKAATTWLCERLALHPQIAFPGGKELQFWNHRDGRPPEAWLAPFAGGAPGVRQGEITPAYALLSESDVREIHRLCPELRVFYCLRNPIERAWSAALMAMERAELTLDETSDAWFLDHFRSEGSRGRGDHEAVLRRWRGVFGEKSVLAILYDDLSSDPVGVLCALARHLGVSEEPFRALSADDVGRRVFTGLGHPLRPSLIDPLRSLYGESIESLGRYLGRDLSGWTALPGVAGTS